MIYNGGPVHHEVGNLIIQIVQRLHHYGGKRQQFSTGHLTSFFHLSSAYNVNYTMYYVRIGGRKQTEKLYSSKFKGNGSTAYSFKKRSRRQKCQKISTFRYR